MAIQVKSGTKTTAAILSLFLYKGSRYAERLPIGDPEIIENADDENYKTLLSVIGIAPILMAIVATGDFDMDWMEKEIKEPIQQNPWLGSNPRERKEYDVPQHR